MKATRVVLLLLAVGGAGTAWVGSLWAEEAPPSGLLKWEYRILTKEQILDAGRKDLTAGLNKLGEDGWELSAVDGGYIFKRPRVPTELRAEEVKRRLVRAQTDAEMWQERVAWAERMFRKGYVTASQLQAEESQLRAAEIALERARKDAKLFPAEKELKPEK